MTEGLLQQSQDPPCSRQWGQGWQGEHRPSTCSRLCFSSRSRKAAWWCFGALLQSGLRFAFVSRVAPPPHTSLSLGLELFWSLKGLRRRIRTRPTLPPPPPLPPLQSANSANTQSIRADTSGQEVKITQKDRPPLALPVSWQEEAEKILAKQLSTTACGSSLHRRGCCEAPGGPK